MLCVDRHVSSLCKRDFWKNNLQQRRRDDASLYKSLHNPIDFRVQNSNLFIICKMFQLTFSISVFQIFHLTPYGLTSHILGFTKSHKLFDLQKLQST